MKSSREHMRGDAGMLGISTCGPARPQFEEVETTHSEWRKGGYSRPQAHGILTVDYRQPLPEASERHGPSETVGGPGAAI
jgi:hypothetical protein